MANRCRIEVSLPLADIPDEKERQQYLALFQANNKWAEQGEKEHFSDEYYKFLATQPGIPFEKCKYRDQELPEISADFQTVDGELWVQPSNSKSRPGLIYQLENHKTICISTEWWFAYDFPWWTQVGFADSKKHFGKFSLNDGDSRGWLRWESDVTKILTNLKYAIKVHETFKIDGEIWEWENVSRYLDDLESIFVFFNRISSISKRAIAILNWSEVAIYTMSYEEVDRNDEPNQIMASIKELAKNKKLLSSNEITLKEYKGKYAEKASEYIPIIKRDPFEGERSILWQKK